MLSPGRQPLSRARDFLFEQFAHAITLDEIAGIAGLSRYHFLKAFTAQFGLTPHAYQIHLRIERSLPLLRQGMSPTQVAESMGFNDQSHYIHHFKRIMGITPGQYKSKTLAGGLVKSG
jgi:AraC-like DNA-binding protein